MDKHDEYDHDIDRAENRGLICGLVFGGCVGFAAGGILTAWYLGFRAMGVL